MKACEGLEVGKACRPLGSSCKSLERLAECALQGTVESLGFTLVRSLCNSYVPDPVLCSWLGILRAWNSCPGHPGDSRCWWEEKGHEEIILKLLGQLCG